MLIVFDTSSSPDRCNQASWFLSFADSIMAGSGSFEV